MVLMFVLLLFTQRRINANMLLFVVLCILTGMTIGLLATKTGEYRFGTGLGYAVSDVPVVIGIHWFIIVYCCAITIYTLLIRIMNKVAANATTVRPTLKAISIIVDAATVAAFMDWIIEPVAVKLNWWHWETGVPFYNYLCWYIFSALLMIDFYYAPFYKENKFAINLLLIQAMFYLLLRTFL